MAKNEVATIDPIKAALTKTFADAAKEMVNEGATAESIALDILNANSVDDILGSTVIALSDIIGTPFTIHSASLNESDFADGLGAYVAMQVTFDDGTKSVVTSGATSVVAQVVSMHQKGYLPYRVSSRKPNKPTAAGYYPVSLCPAPAVEAGF